MSIHCGYSFVYGLIIIVVVSLYAGKARQGNFELQHVHILFRHGDRSPIYGFPNDGHPFDKTWLYGAGQLSNIGIVQHFELGQWLRRRYANFLPTEYNASHYSMRSTDIDRTLMSALSNIAGFYNQSFSPLSKYNVNWRPIPVHTVMEYHDILLGSAPCPMLTILRNEVMDSDEAVAYEDNHRDFFNMLAEKTGKNPLDRNNIWQVYDDLVCLQAHKLTLPDWVTPEVMSTLRESYLYYWNLEFMSSKKILRLEVGVLLHAIFDHIIKLVDEGDVSHSVSARHVSVQPQLEAHHVVAYSAHDTNVAMLLSALEVYDGKPVEYASAVLMEVLGPVPPAPRDQFRFRVVYKRGYPDQQAEALALRPCENGNPELGCDLAKVLTYYQPLFVDPDDFDTVCSV